MNDEIRANTNDKDTEIVPSVHDGYTLSEAGVTIEDKKEEQ